MPSFLLPPTPGPQSWKRHSDPLPHPDAPPPTPQGPLFSQRRPLPPLPLASHTLCVCSSSGTPREGPAGGTGGSGGPGGSLGSRGRRRKLYSAVPGRSFMAVKSYQAQAEGEISLSKGEKIKGKGAGCSRAVGKGRQVNSPAAQGGAGPRPTVVQDLECPGHAGDLREA